jgi:hypothetical protein
MSEEDQIQGFLLWKPLPLTNSRRKFTCSDIYSQQKNEKKKGEYTHHTFTQTLLGNTLDYTFSQWVTCLVDIYFLASYSSKKPHFFLLHHTFSLTWLWEEAMFRNNVFHSKGKYAYIIISNIIFMIFTSLNVNFPLSASSTCILYQNLNNTMISLCF